MYAFHSAGCGSQVSVPAGLELKGAVLPDRGSRAGHRRRHAHEQPINAHRAGSVTALSAQVGATVTSGALLCRIKD